MLSGGRAARLSSAAARSGCRPPAPPLADRVCPPPIRRQDPADAIPKGTLLAILTTFCTYIIYPIMIAASSQRYASGGCREAGRQSLTCPPVLCPPAGPGLGHPKGDDSGRLHHVLHVLLLPHHDRGVCAPLRLRWVTGIRPRGPARPAPRGHTRPQDGPEEPRARETHASLPLSGCKTRALLPLCL